MSQFHNLQESHASSTSLVRCGRWIAHTIRRPRVLDALSWLAWLLTIAAFAVWTYLHYHAPAGPNWIGMTIHTGVFATWTQVVREWLMIRVHHHKDRYNDASTTQQ